MIILLTRSAKSARATAEHLRKASVCGRIVLFFSNDFQAMKLAIDLAKVKSGAIAVNTMLLVSSLLCIFGGALLLILSKNLVLLTQIGQLCFYAGVIAGACLIWLEALFD